MEDLELLARGEVGCVAQIQDSSNGTFVLDLTLDDEYAWAVFKPALGEAPLHDFPPGLYRREVAAYELSKHLGWNLVPPTIVRDIEPFGVGSLQLFIEHEGWHYFPMVDQRPELHLQLQKMAVFDLLANNTDRKSGHCLLGTVRDGEERVWGIDHGLCFHQDPKLRTVIWDFVGTDIPPEWVAQVETLIDDVPAALAELLTAEEVAALQRRANRISRLPWLPQPTSEYPFPWPLV